MTHLTESQRHVLETIARRLRRQADYLEEVARSGDRDQLDQACGMLHAAETQLSWIQNLSEGDDTEIP
jgi:hypothetical protein